MVVITRQSLKIIDESDHPPKTITIHRPGDFSREGALAVPWGRSISRRGKTA
jgi:hypothetical protein